MTASRRHVVGRSLFATVPDKSAFFSTGQLFSQVAVSRAVVDQFGQSVTLRSAGQHVLFCVFVHGGVTDIGSTGRKADGKDAQFAPEGQFGADQAFVFGSPSIVELRPVSPARWVIVEIPDVALAEMLVEPIDSGVLAIPGSSLLRPAREFARAALQAPPSSAAVAYATERVLVELVGSLILDAQSSRGGGGQLGDLRRKAIAYIAESRVDPTLDAVGVAAALNVSVRHLQRAFAKVGGSPAQELRRQRAELARALLTNPRYDVLPMDEIARKAGLQGAADLRRVLQNVFGVTPRSLRAR